MDNKKENVKEFLLEIGVEELPAGYIGPALSHLRSSMESSLKESRLAFEKIEVFGTPNRLVVHVTGLPAKQEAQREKISGPSKESAFDPNGKPTLACLGFLKSKGAELKDLSIESTPKGEYLFIERTMPSVPTKTILAQFLPGLISSIRFPKVMKWHTNGIKFARPIRWLLALYGDERVIFKFGELAGSDASCLPRYIRPEMRKIKIRTIKDYFGKLEKSGVVLDQAKRESNILHVLKKYARVLGAGDNFNLELLKTVNYLVESPHGFVGTFSREYLQLPVEVLESSMAKNQKIFLLKDDKGKALTYFVALLNGKHGDVNAIRKTFEAILNAKLKDSAFFLTEDLKMPLQERVEALKGVVFQAKLGTMHDRVIRLQKLSRYIADSLNLPEEEKKKVERAALLSKADLLTQMVKEFPDLQGIIGREYAKRTGEDKDVCRAIYEHYLPKGVNDSLPQARISNILAIADKIDATVGFFAIGLVPTGSEDPYGIRRASLGLLKILSEEKYPLSLGDLIDKAFELYGNAVTCDKAVVKSQILAFQRDRLKNILLDKKFKDDIIDAVLFSGFDRFDRLSKKLSDLSSIAQAKYFLEAAKVIERISNILKGDKKLKESALKVKPEYFKEPLEKELWDIYGKNVGRINERIEAGDYAGATKIYAEAFSNPIHLFFEKVIVNAEDQGLRTNRFALLKLIHAAYVDKTADLSKITQNITHKKE